MTLPKKKKRMKNDLINKKCHSLSTLSRCQEKVIIKQEQKREKEKAEPTTATSNINIENYCEPSRQLTKSKKRNFFF